MNRVDCGECGGDRQQLQIVYDVFLPDAKFRKSDPGVPAVCLCISRWETSTSTFSCMQCLKCYMHESTYFVQCLSLVFVMCCIYFLQKTCQYLANFSTFSLHSTTNKLLYIEAQVCIAISVHRHAVCIAIRHF